MRSRFIAPLLGACLAAFALGAAAQADKYPSKPVRIIVAFPPGSATDVAARRVAAKLTNELGQSFFVENKPGAFGNIGGEMAAQAPKDGYTLFAGTTSEMAINKPGGMKMRFDPAKDFAPVALLFTSQPVLIASNASKFNTVADLVAAAKAKPGTVNWSQVNAFQQVVLATFERVASVNLNVVPYKGTALAMNDVLGGQIDGMVGYPAEAMVQVNAGKAKALALGGAKRNPFMPNTPTLNELGYPLDLVVWGAVFAPTGTPTAIVEQLNRAIVAANRAPDIKEALAKTGSEVQLFSASEFTAFMNNEYVKWDKVVKDGNVKLSD
ncbi:MAG: tripartite tricarboxylate transporter substrate binding protein [Comamonadaceae bacterium]|nr:MAG: tripartite tricarboxylate transporter substrate binding protein [Comamonadaceae bacterium]